MQWRPFGKLLSQAFSPIALAIVILFSLVLFTAYQQFFVQAPEFTEVVGGKLQLSSEPELPLLLNGEWQFYWQQLLTPSQLTGDYRLVPVPSRWRELSIDGESVDAPGYATYALDIHLDSPSAGLGLCIPLLYRSARLWVNGELLAEVGRPGTSAAEEIPRDEITLVRLPDGVKQLQLVLQVSSFHHVDGGISHPLVLDDWDNLQQAERWRIVRGVSLMTSTLTLAIYLLIMWGYASAGREYLYLGLGLFWYAVRLFGKERLIFYLYPDFSVEWLLRCVYYGMYLCVPAYMLFIQSFFPRDINRRVLQVFWYVGIAAALVTTLTPSIIYTRMRDPYEPYALAMMAYFMVCLIRIVWLRRQWSGMVAFLGGVTTLIFINESLYLRGLVTVQLSPLAYILVALTSLLFLGQRMNLQLLSEAEQSTRLQQAVNEQTEQLQEKMQELDAARRHAVELAQQRSEFIAELSHEIRTPLAGMLGAIRLWGNGQNSIDDAQLKNHALEAGESLLAVVNQSLDAASLERKHTLYPSCQQPAHSFHAIANIMAITAGDKGLAFRYSPCTAEDWVLADFQKLRQITANLLSNAIKFTVSGEVHLRIDCYPRGECPEGLPHYDADYLLAITVTDTGPGIAPQEQSRIFDAYVQLSEGAGKETGAGLGLAITRQLVELHGGHILLNSAPQQGACFTVTLPVEACTPEMPQDLPCNQSETSMRVLVVEDDDINRTVVTELLQQLGHKVVATHSPERGLQQLQGCPFDVLLLDIRLPEMSGLTLLGHARALAASTQSPLYVALTANTGAEDLADYRQAGFDYVLEKPVDRQQLAYVLAHAGWPRPEDDTFLLRHQPQEVINGELILIDWSLWQGIVHDLGEERACGLLQAAEASIDQSLQALAKAAKVADKAAVKHVAHKLKSAARSVGLLQVAGFADTIESDADTAAQLLKPMTISVSESLRQLSSSLNSRHNPLL